MADVTVGLLNLLPGVPAVSTLAQSTTAGTDGVSFTALLSTQITQLGTATVPTGDDLLDLETTNEVTTEATTANPLALLLGGVLLPIPLPVVQPKLTETTTATTTAAQLPEIVPAAVPTRVDASRVESLRFEGPANPIAPATPNAVETTANTPDVQPTSTPTSTHTPSQPVAPPQPQNTTPITIEPSQVPPAARVVVPQTPVVTDRTQTLPPPPVELRPVPVQQPVTEPEPIAGLPPVVAGHQPAIQQPAIQQQRPNVAPQAVPTKPDAPFADVVKQAAATPARPSPVTIPQAINPEIVPATTAGNVLAAVRPMTAAFEQEWKTAVTADGTQPVDSARVLPHATPVQSNPTGTPDRTVTDTRQSLTPASQIGDTWITHAAVQSRGGEHEFQIRLDPPELGEVRVRVHSSADGVRAELTVASDAVRAMIESQIPELRQRLQDGGVSVTQFDVTTNTPGGDSSARNPYRESAPPDVRAESTVPTAKPGRTRDPTAAVGGLLDVTA